MYLWPELNNFIGNGCVETNLAPELNNFRGNGCVETNPAPPQGPGADCFPAEVPAQGAQVGLIGMHAGGNVSWKTCMRSVCDVLEVIPQSGKGKDTTQLINANVKHAQILHASTHYACTLAWGNNTQDIPAADHASFMHA
eukprot:1153299-Pelagomonas_calceolata.AAC.4